MGIFNRVVDIIKSNINDLIDKAEDPEKMVKMLVIEMQESVVKSTSSLAQAMANRNRLENKYKMYEAKSEEWQQKALQALKAGKEELAKEALKKKALVDDQAVQYKAMFEKAKAQTDHLKEQVDKLKQKLEEAKMKESMLIARSQNADAQKEIAENLSGIGSTSFAKFDKFEEKIMKKEAEAEAFSELIGEDTTLEDQFAELEKNNRIDDDLEKLKSMLNEE
jgi:phage shock protein A